MQRTFLLLTTVVLSFCSHLTAQTTLRQATQDLFLIGVAVNNQPGVGRPKQNKSRHFSAIVRKLHEIGGIHPEEHRYNFEATDQMLAFGRTTKVVTGHCLIWHSQLARWFCVDEQGEPVSAEVLKSRMRSTSSAS